jgi:membrane fusion protein (multidrug efflux system)
MPPDPPEKPDVRPMSEADPPGASQGPEQAPKQPARRRPGRNRAALIGGGALLAVVIAAGLIWWIHARDYQVTNDAYLDGDIVYVAPQIAGRVVRVWITDNQLVAAGQPLVDIDPALSATQVQKAEAQAAQARAQIAQAETVIRVNSASLKQDRAITAAKQADAALTLARYRTGGRVGPTAASQPQLDPPLDRAESAAARTDAARDHARAARRQIELARGQIEQGKAQLVAAEAEVRRSQVELRYTRIYADAAGYVTHRTVASGDSVQPGQPLMAITPLRLWVTANYKETQLSLMRKGQPVWIHIDAIPGKTFRGHVDSFSHGAARAFAIQPPLNATGNFMKVVQPVPVKIVFDDHTVFDRPIGPGMSVEPRVKVR